ncbi:hypothetical protein LMG28727_03475 [Paraburkholderia kirstenboschensis]|nr:hypothetical protein LMG28727_03475 [Paraburkholderia kirstenboschensis]
MGESVKDLGAVQALGLHQMLAASAAHVVAVTGSSQAVGCTTAVVHLAIALARQGMDVLVLDEYAGNGSASALLGAIKEAGMFASLPNGRLPRVQAVGTGPLPVAITGPGDTNEQRYGAVAYDAAPAAAPDVVLIDAAFSDGSVLSPLALQAHDVLLVTTMTANAVAETYVRMKRLRLTQGIAQFRIVMNRVDSEVDAHAVLENLRGIARDYLAVSILDAGCIRAVPCIARAAELPRAIQDALRPSAAVDDFVRLASGLRSWPRRPAAPSRSPAPTLSSVRAMTRPWGYSPPTSAPSSAPAREAPKSMCRIYRPRFN